MLTSTMASDSEDIIQEQEVVEEEESVVYLLDKLRCPRESNLARKRKVQIEPQKVSLSSRIKEFPDQHLSTNKGKLLCREFLSLKKSVISFHVKSAKHQAGLERLVSKDKRDRNIADMLKKYDADVHPSGETLPEAVRVYRVKVLTNFLKAGVPLDNIIHIAWCGS